MGMLVEKPTLLPVSMLAMVTMLALLALTPGCTMTKVTVNTDKSWSVTRCSLFQKVSAKVTLPGVGSLDQYENDGGGAAFMAAIDKAYELGMKAAKETAAAAAK